MSLPRRAAVYRLDSPSRRGPIPGGLTGRRSSTPDLPLVHGVLWIDTNPSLPDAEVDALIEAIGEEHSGEEHIGEEHIGAVSTADNGG